MAKSEEKYAKRRLKTSYVSTVVSLTLVLYMLGLLGLIVLHAKKLSDYVKENIGFSIMLKEDAKKADINMLQKKLDAAVYVNSTKFIGKDEAAEDLQAELGEDFVEFLGYNPLLSSIDVHLKASYANNDSLSIIEKQITENKIVKEVFYQKSLVHLVNENVKRIGVVLLGFSSLLLVIAIALINNTIRLSVYSKRFLIKSMQLIGATQRFIRKPFVIKGIMQGVIGAVLAILLVAATIYFAQRQIKELKEFQDIELYLSLFAIVGFLGIIISWISTYFAVRKYLKIKTDQLYYY